MEILSKSTISF